MYEKNYHEKVHEDRIKSTDAYSILALRSKLKYFKNIENDKNVLDYGGGLGQNVYLLKNRYVYDISKYALSFCKKKGIPVIEDLKTISNEHFDIIICSHVLEHVENPNIVLKEIYDKLKKGGELILVLPREQHNKITLEPDINQHLYCWNFRTINNLLYRVGFSVKSNEYYYKNTGLRKFSFVGKFNLKIFYYLTLLME